MSEQVSDTGLSEAFLASGKAALDGRVYQSVSSTDGMHYK